MSSFFRVPKKLSSIADPDAIRRRHAEVSVQRARTVSDGPFAKYDDRHPTFLVVVMSSGEVVTREGDPAMLTEFLQKNEGVILALTEQKTLELAGDHPSSALLKEGLPRFYRQVIEVIRAAGSPAARPAKDVDAIARAADRGDEQAMATAAGQPREAELARTAGLHGFEMLRLGYTLSHVVHAYGAMCQAITETAAESDASIGADEFHALNRCLDVAIAGAVTDFQSRKDDDSEGQGGQGLAEEIRRTVLRGRAAFEAIQRGAVGANGSTGQSLESSFDRLEKLTSQLVAGDGSSPRPGSA